MCYTRDMQNLYICESMCINRGRYGPCIYLVVKILLVGHTKSSAHHSMPGAWSAEFFLPIKRRVNPSSYSSNTGNTIPETIPFFLSDWNQEREEDWSRRAVRARIIVAFSTNFVDGLVA